MINSWFFKPFWWSFPPQSKRIWRHRRPWVSGTCGRTPPRPGRARSFPRWRSWWWSRSLSLFQTSWGRLLGVGNHCGQYSSRAQRYPYAVSSQRIVKIQIFEGCCRELIENLLLRAWTNKVWRIQMKKMWMWPAACDLILSLLSVFSVSSSSDESHIDLEEAMDLF